MKIYATNIRALRICVSGVALWIVVGVANSASAKDPFSYFRRGGAKTVSQPVEATDAPGAGKQGVVQAAPEVVPAHPSASTPFAAEGPAAEFAPEPEYAGGGCGSDGYGGDAYRGEVFSVWPGVPACCDPWLGYCQEPRHYPCAKGQGRYIYYVSPHVKNKKQCGGYFITWAHGSQADCNCGQPAAYAGGGCDSCVSVTDAVRSSPTPVPAPTQGAPAMPSPDSMWDDRGNQQPPRNAMPPATARTISSGAAR